MTVAKSVVLLLVWCACARGLGAQVASRVTCVTSRDTAWRPTYFGFDTDNQLRRRGAAVVDRAYPVVDNVRPTSPADSAGIRNGDQVIEINGADLERQHDAVRANGPGVPTRFRFRRGDQTFDRVLVGLPAARCADSRR